ncbi:hypothetical protein TNCV_3038621 [Trichonephila clavipes]|nr:hypothetical protein TNCV_3038621 [Trichonephila clavipes]
MGTGLVEFGARGALGSFRVWKFRCKFRNSQQQKDYFYLIDEDCLMMSRSPPDEAAAFQLLHSSINRQVANMIMKNCANLALSPTFRCFH